MKLFAWRTCFVVLASAQEELPMGRLDKCEGFEKQLSACNQKDCPEKKCIDCSWAEWGVWGSCSCTGLQERQRTIGKTNSDCGKPCSGPKVETQSCHPSCSPPSVDCEFGPWSEWDKCNKQCGSGQMFRERTIKSLLKDDGSPCEGMTRETKFCNTKLCRQPIDCELSKWEKDGHCSATCGGGQQNFVRHLSTQPAFGGRPCIAELSKIEECNTQRCSNVTDCLWEEWQTWGACSRSCGGGETSRSRLIKIAPRDGGKLCTPLDMSEVAACNTHACEKAVDCKIGQWSDWDACSCVCNGIQRRNRHIETYPKIDGKPCTGPLEEIQGCNTHCDEPVKQDSKDCQLGAWGTWSACTVSCGIGEHLRSRTIVQRAVGSGKACNGELEMLRECDLHPCEDGNQERKADCVVSAWAEWNICSVTCGGGHHERHRKIETMPSKHGESCSHIAIRESEACNTKPCHCVSCQWGVWNDWGACTCTGLMERHRGIVRHYENCGDYCEGTKTETTKCTPDCATKSASCDLSEWSHWGRCSVSCGGGQTFRQRGVRTLPRNGGHLCTDNLRETKACNSEPCIAKEDCELNQWSHWDECTVTCGGGQRSRFRELESPAIDGGKGCSAALSEVNGCAMEPCVTRTDCVWAQWSDWGACSATCDGGQKSRDRTIKVAPRNGGKLCDPFSMEEIAPCNAHQCARGCLDGKLSVWSEWSYCSASCDVGFQARHRQVAQQPNYCGRPIGVNEFQELQQFAACNLKPCSEFGVDCVLSEWSPYGDCSCTADGVRERSRGINTYQSNGGKPCDGSLKEVEPCNVGEAAAKDADCDLSEWSSWTSCSHQCDGGYRTHSRTVKHRATGSAPPCKTHLGEVKPCNLHPCHKAIDCKWSDWTDWGGCSVHCGGGQRNRYRHIIVASKYNGKECQQSHTAEVTGCNEHLCSETRYCQWDTWTSWTHCTKSCGSGQMSRERQLIASTIHHSEIMEALNVSLDHRFGSDHLILMFVAGILSSMLVVLLTTVYRRAHYRPEFTRLLDDPAEHDIRL